MSMSLLAAILLFTFGTNSITGLDSVDLCKALACMLHYFLLSSVVWMSIEAYNLYQDLVKVFDTTLLSHSDFMCRAGVLAWSKFRFYCKFYSDFICRFEMTVEINDAVAISTLCHWLKNLALWRCLYSRGLIYGGKFALQNRLGL